MYVVESERSYNVTMASQLYQLLHFIFSSDQFSGVMRMKATRDGRVLGSNSMIWNRGWETSGFLGREKERQTRASVVTRAIQ